MIMYDSQLMCKNCPQIMVFPGYLLFHFLNCEQLISTSEFGTKFVLKCAAFFFLNRLTIEKISAPKQISIGIFCSKITWKGGNYFPCKILKLPVFYLFHMK